MKTIFQLMISAMLFFSACGPNAFKSLEATDPAEDATVALEEGNPQRAIDILTDALENDPGNEQYISILALAYAQRAGVDPLTLAQNMATSSKSSSEGSSEGTSAGSSSSKTNDVTALFGIMPEATEGSIADVDMAVELLLSIPSDNRQSYDTLKLAMFEIAAMTLRAKILDTDGDGILSTAELLAMSPDSALAILNQLAGAAGAFASGDEMSTTDEAASEQVSKIQAAIQSEPGATDEEKLKSYLGKSRS